MEDRRASHRQHLRCDIQCDTGSEVFDAEALDLSEDGVSFACQAQVKPGDVLTLEYRPTEDDPLMVVRVIVQNVQGTRVGARFISPHTASAKAQARGNQL